MQVSTTVDESGDAGMVVKRLSVPMGLEELMESLTKQVLMKKPKDIFTFAYEHFAHLVSIRDKLNEEETKLGKQHENKGIKIKAATIGTKFQKLPSPINFVNSKHTVSTSTKSTTTTRTSYMKQHVTAKSLEKGRTVKSSTSSDSTSVKESKSSSRGQWAKTETSIEKTVKKSTSTSSTTSSRVEIANAARKNLKEKQLKSARQECVKQISPRKKVALVKKTSSTDSEPESSISVQGRTISKSKRDKSTDKSQKGKGKVSKITSSRDETSMGADKNSARNDDETSLSDTFLPTDHSLNDLNVTKTDSIASGESLEFDNVKIENEQASNLDEKLETIREEIKASPDATVKQISKSEEIKQSESEINLQLEDTVGKSQSEINDLRASLNSVSAEVKDEGNKVQDHLEKIDETVKDILVTAKKEDDLVKDVLIANKESFEKSQSEKANASSSFIEHEIDQIKSSEVIKDLKPTTDEEKSDEKKEESLSKNENDSGSFIREEVMFTELSESHEKTKSENEISSSALSKGVENIASSLINLDGSQKSEVIEVNEDSLNKTSNEDSKEQENNKENISQEENTINTIKEETVISTSETNNLDNEANENSDKTILQNFENQEKAVAKEKQLSTDEANITVSSKEDIPEEVTKKETNSLHEQSKSEENVESKEDAQTSEEYPEDTLIKSNIKPLYDSINSCDKFLKQEIENYIFTSQERSEQEFQKMNSKDEGKEVKEDEITIEKSSIQTVDTSEGFPKGEIENDLNETAKTDLKIVEEDVKNAIPSEKVVETIEMFLQSERNLNEKGATDRERVDTTEEFLRNEQINNDLKNVPLKQTNLSLNEETDSKETLKRSKRSLDLYNEEKTTNENDIDSNEENVKDKSKINHNDDVPTLITDSTNLKEKNKSDINDIDETEGRNEEITKNVEKNRIFNSEINQKADPAVSISKTNEIELKLNEESSLEREKLTETSDQNSSNDKIKDSIITTDTVKSTEENDKDKTNIVENDEGQNVIEDSANFKEENKSKIKVLDETEGQNEEIMKNVEKNKMFNSEIDRKVDLTNSTSDSNQENLKLNEESSEKRMEGGSSDTEKLKEDSDQRINTDKNEKSSSNFENLKSSEENIKDEMKMDNNEDAQTLFEDSTNLKEENKSKMNVEETKGQNENFNSEIVQKVELANTTPETNEEDKKLNEESKSSEKPLEGGSLDGEKLKEASDQSSNSDKHEKSLTNIENLTSNEEIVKDKMKLDISEEVQTPREESKNLEAEDTSQINDIGKLESQNEEINDMDKIETENEEISKNIEKNKSFNSEIEKKADDSNNSKTEESDKTTNINPEKTFKNRSLDDEKLIEKSDESNDTDKIVKSSSTVESNKSTEENNKDEMKVPILNKDSTNLKEEDVFQINDTHKSEGNTEEIINNVEKSKMFNSEIVIDQKDYNVSERNVKCIPLNEESNINLEIKKMAEINEEIIENNTSTAENIKSIEEDNPNEFVKNESKEASRNVDSENSESSVNIAKNKQFDEEKEVNADERNDSNSMNDDKFEINTNLSSNNTEIATSSEVIINDGKKATTKSTETITEVTTEDKNGSKLEETLKSNKKELKTDIEYEEKQTSSDSNIKDSSLPESTLQPIDLKENVSDTKEEKSEIVEEKVIECLQKESNNINSSNEIAAIPEQGIEKMKDSDNKAELEEKKIITEKHEKFNSQKEEDLTGDENNIGAELNIEQVTSEQIEKLKNMKNNEKFDLEKENLKEVSDKLTENKETTINEEEEIDEKINEALTKLNSIEIPKEYPVPFKNESKNLKYESETETKHFINDKDETVDQNIQMKDTEKVNEVLENSNEELKALNSSIDINIVDEIVAESNSQEEKDKMLENTRKLNEETEESVSTKNESEELNENKTEQQKNNNIINNEKFNLPKQLTEEESNSHENENAEPTDVTNESQETNITEQDMTKNQNLSLRRFSNLIALTWDFVLGEKENYSPNVDLKVRTAATDSDTDEAPLRNIDKRSGSLTRTVTPVTEPQILAALVPVDSISVLSKNETLLNEENSINLEVDLKGNKEINDLTSDDVEKNADSGKSMKDISVEDQKDEDDEEKSKNNQTDKGTEDQNKKQEETIEVSTKTDNLEGTGKQALKEAALFEQGTISFDDQIEGTNAIQAEKSKEENSESIEKDSNKTVKLSISEDDKALEISNDEVQSNEVIVEETSTTDNIKVDDSNSKKQNSQSEILSNILKNQIFDSEKESFDETISSKDDNVKNLDDNASQKQLISAEKTVTKISQEETLKNEESPTVKIIDKVEKHQDNNSKEIIENSKNEEENITITEKGDRNQSNVVNTNANDSVVTNKSKETSTGLKLQSPTMEDTLNDLKQNIESEIHDSENEVIEEKNADKKLTTDETEETNENKVDILIIDDNYDEDYDSLPEEDEESAHDDSKKIIHEIKEKLNNIKTIIEDGHELTEAEDSNIQKETEVEDSKTGQEKEQSKRVFIGSPTSFDSAVTVVLADNETEQNDKNDDATVVSETKLKQDETKNSNDPDSNSKASQVIEPTAEKSSNVVDKETVEETRKMNIREKEKKNNLKNKKITESNKETKLTSQKKSKSTKSTVGQFLKSFSEPAPEPKNSTEKLQPKSSEILDKKSEMKKQSFFLHAPDSLKDNPISDAIKATSQITKQEATIGLLHSGEFHDYVPFSYQLQKDKSTKNEQEEENVPVPELQPSVEKSENDTDINAKENEDPAGVTGVTLRGDVAHALLKDEAPSAAGSSESVSGMEAKRNNATVQQESNNNSISMESQAATKIQASFRGYQVRKQLKSKNGGDIITPTKRSNRRKTSSSNMPDSKKIKEDDLEEKSATKIQAGVRGFLVRRRQQRKI